MRTIEQVTDPTYPFRTLKEFLESRYKRTKAKIQLDEEEPEEHYNNDSREYLLGELEGYRKALQEMRDLAYTSGSDLSWQQELDYFEKLDKEAESYFKRGVK